MQLDGEVGAEKGEKMPIEYLVSVEETGTLYVVFRSLFAFFDMEQMFSEDGKKMEKPQKMKRKQSLCREKIPCNRI